MVHTKSFLFTTVLSLLVVLPRVLAHGHDDHAGKIMDLGAPDMPPVPPSPGARPSTVADTPFTSPESYFAYSELAGVMLAHIVIMVIAWFFILPIGVMLSVARSRFALVTQLSFLGVHSVGLLLGTVYANKTPNLYENDSHGKLGWILTWVVVAQCIIGLVKLAASLGKSDDRTSCAEEQVAFLPIAAAALAQHPHFSEAHPQDSYRYSHDSGHFTASEPSRSQSISSAHDHDEEEQQKLREYENAHDDAEGTLTEKRGLLPSAKLERCATRIASLMSRRTLKVLNAVHNAIDRVILLLGFIAFVSGAAVYGGVFRGHNLFSGLAHTIKGGIFFWYGLLTLGRWMGCFVEVGWAWNIRPPVGVVSSRKAAIPSAEFVESFVIFLYGSTNVFLEHLAAWGHSWSAQDLEHVSISIMFFGGGLCGMLIESSRIRDLLNSVILTSPATHGSQSTKEHLTPPKTYPFSMNPFPALIILLLGLMMSSHHQNSMVATMVHKQWGTLFIGFALARAVTYILTYVSPPSSYLPSRPPSELITSFCLISGGIIFMASNKDTVGAMEHYGLHAMFPFTVTMGFTSFLMAWAIVVLAVKGWAVRKAQPSLP